MSVKAITQVWEYSKQKGSHRFLLVAIADAANDDGECFEGIARLAKKMAVDERTVQRLVADLAQTDELAVIWRGYTGSKRAPDKTHPRAEKRYRPFTNFYYLLCGLPEEEIREIKAYCARKNAEDTTAQAIIQSGKLGPAARNLQNNGTTAPAHGDNLSPIVDDSGDKMSPTQNAIGGNLSPIDSVLVTNSAQIGDIAMSPRLLNVKSPSREPQDVDLSDSLRSETIPEAGGATVTPPAQIMDAPGLSAFEEGWKAAAQQLKLQMRPGDYQTHIQKLRLVSGGEGTLVLGAPTEYSAAWVRDRLTTTIARQIEPLIGVPVKIEVIHVQGGTNGKTA